MKEKLYIPQMLLIGATNRNSGKTTLAVAAAKLWKDYYPVIGLKITAIQEKDGKCPRGGEGCGVCANVKGEYEISEETNISSNKDTSILLASGISKVYWLKTLKSHMYEGIQNLMSQIPKNTLIICESNSLREIVVPGGFIMLNNQENSQMKNSASEVIHMADLIITGDVRNSMDSIIKNFRLTETQSEIKISFVEDNYKK
jgi:hypothetical protein